MGGGAVDQILPFAGRGTSVISSCEEMTCPIRANEETALRVERVVALNTRRGALRHKMSVGAPVAEVRERVAAGGAGHIGLRESLHLIARGLGARLSGERHELEPIEDGGRGAGVREWLAATLDTGVRLELELIMSAIAPAGRDVVEVTGSPSFRAVIEGGVAGDEATVGRMANLVTPVLQAAPGFQTLLDLPLSRGARGSIGRERVSEVVR